MQFKYKIVLAGTKNVGKSSLLARFTDGTFKENMLDTIGVDFKRKKVEFDGYSVDLTIWDFAGEEKFRTLFPSYLNAAAGALVLYDITNKDSLVDIKNWCHLIDSHACDQVVKLLIGTKADLEATRVVSRDEALAVHDTHGFSCDLVETSAKTGENVETAFKEAIREIVAKRMKPCVSCNEWNDTGLKLCRHCGEPNG